MLHYKNQAGISWGLLSLCIALPLVLSQQQLLAQGFVAVVSNPTEVAKTNRSALSGTLFFDVSVASAGPGEIVIDYGIPIEDTGVVSDDSRMSIDETDLASGILTVRFLEEINTGEVLTLSGVRLDMVATDAEWVVANLSVVTGSNFFILTRYRSVEVISRVLPGLEVDVDSNVVFTLPGRSFRPQQLTLTLKEGFPSAFSGNTGQFNQNAPTRVKIRITGLPEGVFVTFPDSVSPTRSRATLTVTEGSETKLPAEDDDRTILYEFTPQLSSNRRVEVFQLDYTVEMDTPEDESTDNSQPPAGRPVAAEPTAVFLQATLAPGEDEQCGGNPCIPRYQTEFVPPEEELPFPEFETYFPISSRLGPLRLQFTNQSNLDLPVRLEALNPAGRLVLGPDIVNPASLPVGQGEQISVAIEEVFGSGILDVETGTIAARTRRAGIGAIFLLGDDQTRGDGGAASQPPRNRFLLPNLSREGEGPFTIVHLFNPSEDTSTEIQVSLYDGGGERVSSTERALGPRGTISESAETFFAVELSDFQGGYIRGEATGEGVVAHETFGNEKTINHLAGQATSVRKPSYGVAHIALGAGLETELNLINSDESKDAELRISVVDDFGQATLTSPVFVVGSREQRVIDLSDLFGLSLPSLFPGSLEVELLNVFFGPYLVAPSINGSVRFKSLDGRTSVTIPLFRGADRDALYAHVAQDPGLFTGVAIKNRGRVPVDGIVEAFDAAGQVVGAADFQLDPGARLAKLLFELIPETFGQRGGGFRVLSPEGAVESFALFGDLTGEWIASIPRQD